MTIEDKVLKWARDNLNYGFTFRKYQLETIVNIIDNILNNHQSNQIIEAPTGSGKSIIILVSAGVLSEYYNKKSYVLCSDLSLWDQYYAFIRENDLPFGYLKGQKGNYSCLVNKNPVRCGECRIAGKSWATMMGNADEDFPCSKKCKYVKDRRRACLKNVTLMTYQCYLYTLMHQDKVDKGKTLFAPTPREIIFCDECHHLSDVVSTQFSPHLSYTDIELADSVYTFLKSQKVKCNLEDSPAKFKKDLLDLYENLKNTNLTSEEDLKLVNKFYDKYSILWEAVKEQEGYYMDRYKTFNKNEKSNAAKMYKSFENIIVYGDQYRDLLKSLDSSEFLIKELNGESITFYNLKQDYLVYKCLLGKAEHRVMLSATIGNIGVFTDNIGLKYLVEPNYTFSRIPSTFNFDKSPVIVYPYYRLNYQNKETYFPKIKEIIFEICRKFKCEKGIIQTTSYKDALSIYNSAPEDIKERLLVYNNSSEKATILRNHLITENSILLGPTINEGLDLPDDLCRFIIISKIPYPQLTSVFVKRKKELFKGWYQSVTSLKIIQTIGRGVRNENDYCETFILDGCFLDLLDKTIDQYPQELINRIKIKDN